MAKGMYGSTKNGSLKGSKAQSSFVNTPATGLAAPKKGFKKR